MATLTGKKIKNTYDALLKLSDNDNLTTTAKQVTDGFGNNAPLYISTTQIGIGVTPEVGYDLHVYSDAKVGGNLTITGDLTVNGTTTTVDTDTLRVEDPLIELARLNTSADSVDIGFYGKYHPSATTLYSGLFRDAGDDKFKLFKSLQEAPTTTVNTSGTGYAVATLVADVEGTLTGTIASSTVATTQSQNDNSTKVATTAYVDLAIDGVDTLGEVLSNGDTTDGNNIVFGDSATIGTDDTLIFGAGNDLRIAHNGTDSVIRNYTGGLYIDSDGADRNIHIRNDDGSGSKTDYMVFNGAVGFTINYKLQNFQDNVSATFGNSSDLQIYHDGSNSYIDDSGTGRLNIRGSIVHLEKYTGEIMAKFTSDGSVELNYNDSKKFETTSSGIAVTGTADISSQVLVGGNDSIFAENNIRFKSSGGAFIDHNTTGQSISFRTSVSSALDTTPLVLSGADATFAGAVAVNGGDLDVTAGNLTVKTSDNLSSVILELKNNDNNGYTFLRSHTTGFLEIDGNQTGANGYVFKTDSTAALTIANNANATFAGNVEVNGSEINLDSSSTAALIIDRAGTSNDAIVSWRNAGSEYFRAGLDNTDNNLWSLLHTCGSGLYFEGNSMNFGIGTSTPQKTLHIEGDGGASESQLLITGASDTVGHTAGILFRAESGEGDSALRAKGAIFFERQGSNGLGDFHICVNNSNNNDTATLSDSRLVINETGEIYNTGSGTASNYNTFYGSEALKSLTTGQQNTAMGRYAGRLVTEGNYNSFFGLNAGTALTTGSFNTVYGFAALESQTTASQSTAIGAYALNSNVTGVHNTAVGYQAMYANTASYNTGLGYQALRNNTSGSENHAVGRFALYNTTTGIRNTGSGNSALESNTTGTRNTAFGYAALYSQTTAADNTALGYLAGQDLTTGGDNTLVGSEAGKNLTSGQQNIAIGKESLLSATSAQTNTAIGYAALYSCTANDNVAIGYLAGQDVSTGTLNTMLGNYAGRNVTTSSYGTFIGRTAGQNHTTGGEPFYVGYDAGQQVTTGSYNTAIGTSAMTYGNGTKNCFVGFHSGFGASGHQGNYNTALGADSLESINGGDYNTAIGFDAGQDLTTADHNTFLGALSGRYATTGQRNTFVGSQTADNSVVTGSDNVALGCRAANNITSAANNVAIGASCLEISTSGEGQVAIGFEALKDCTTGSGNIAIGKKAGENLTTGGSNTFIGYAAAGGGTVSGAANICIGDATGYNLSGGSNNILIGQNAGRTGSQTPQSLGAVTTNSNEIQMGNGSHTGAYIQIGWTTVSDARDKGQIKDVPHGLDFVSQLQPKSFEFKSDREAEETDGIERYGFLAQDVLELEGDNPVVVNKNDENKLKMTNDYLVPILVNAIKELKQEIEILKSK
jgi:hypothetical protein